MHIVLVHVNVKPEFVDQFKQIVLENARQSVLEEGIARFDVLQQRDDPTRFILTEVYRDENAPARHKETAHYKKWRELAEPMMAEPRGGVWYANLFPGDEGW
jgi:(4S)-4-hydroxy-5-phosphonooxypentane-2,3-dione isomerase